MTVGRAPTAARVAGDDFQFLVAAISALRALHDPRGLVRFAIEARDAAPFDDIVVEFVTPPHEYVQVKFSVDAANPLTCDDLLASGDSGKSLLQRMFERWRALHAPARPSLRLYCGRAIDPNDPVLARWDAQTELLVPFALGPEAKGATAARTRWASHLGADVSELDAFLADLRIAHGRSEASERELLQARMALHNLRSDDEAVTLLIATVRGWVKGARPAFTRDELADAIERAGVGAPRAATHVSFSIISRDQHAGSADVRRDVTDAFDPALDPMSRREPLLPSAWRDAIAPAFVSARHEVARRGADRVLVTGDMRLGCWFLAGAEFRDVAGYAVVCGRRRQYWPSDVGGDDVEAIVAQEIDVGSAAEGTDLAVALAITHAIGEDVGSYVRAQLPGVPRVVALSVGVPSPRAVRDAAHAASIARGVQRAVHRTLATPGVRRLHLFLAAPAGLALLIGNRWNRLRPTTVYDDLGPGRGYVPVFDVAA